MKVLYSEAQTVASVSHLTRGKLTAFVNARIITPLHVDSGPAYREIDLARLELLCELSEQFDLEDEALGVIISLIDQLHGARADLKATVEALSREPADVRERISQAVRAARRID